MVSPLIIGFTHGCFDNFSEGHSYYLTTCRRQCDYLIVAVHSLRQNIVNDLRTRMLHVRAYAEAAIPMATTASDLLKNIRPDVVFMNELESPHLSAYTGLGWRAPVVRIPRLGEGPALNVVNLRPG